MSNIIVVPVGLKFSVQLNVELNHIDQASAMVTAFDDSYDAEGGFDFSKALQIAKEHEGMAVIGTKSIKQNSVAQQVWVSIEQLQNMMQLVQGAATENWAMFGAAAKAFLDLNAQNNGSYFTIFNQSSSSISYRYNMFQVTQNKETGSVMSGQLTSVDITMQKENVNFLALTAGSSVSVEMLFKSLVVVEALQKK